MTLREMMRRITSDDYKFADPKKQMDAITAKFGDAEVACLVLMTAAQGDGAIGVIRLVPLPRGPEDYQKIFYEMRDIHILAAGRALCGLANCAPPSEWPEGASWVGIDDEVSCGVLTTCETCRALWPEARARLKAG